MIWVALLCVALSVWPVFDEVTLPGEVLGQFRLQWMIGLVVPLIWCVWKRANVPATIIALAMLANGYWIYSGLQPVAATSAASDSRSVAVKVLSFNAWKNNATPQRIIDTIIASDADIVWLQEVHAPMRSRFLSELAGRYPFFYAPENNSLPQSSAMLSKHPFDAQTVNKTTSARPHRFVHAKMDVRGVPVHFVGLHLYSPVSTQRLALRHEQMHYTAHYMRETFTADDHVIVAGDMNSVAWRPTFQAFRALSRLNTAGTFSEMALSWPTFLPWPIAVPIDQILMSPTLCSDGMKRLPSAGSDHYPVSARLYRC